MNTLKVIFATLVIFGAGLVIGGLAVKHATVEKPSAQRSLGGPNGAPGQGRLRELLHRMDRELALSIEQHERIEKIIAGSQERTQEIWKPVSLEINKETTKVCEEIRDQLNPDQQKKFDTFSRNRSEHSGERGRRGRPPGATNRVTTSTPD